MLTASEPRTQQNVLLLLLLFGFYLLVASSTTLWDRDEPRFARAAVEMWHSGDYMVPRFNGELRPDKPPLVYWCMNPWISWFGATDLAVRMPSIIGSLVMALATFHIGRNLGGIRVGRRALWLLLCMPLPIFIGTAATADGTLLAGVTVSLAVLVDRLIQGQRSGHGVILFAALSCALLAKGPVGLAPFWLGTVFIAWVGKDDLRWDRRWWWEAFAATAIALLCFLAWGWPANEQTGGELARLGLGRHVFQRIAEPLESHGGSGLFGWLVSLPFYLPVLFLGAAPASALLIPGIVKRKGFSNEQRRVWWILASLILPVFLLMTLVATKLPHYILATFPGVAVACSWYWSQHSEQISTSSKSLAEKIGVWITILLLATLGIAWVFAVEEISGSVMVAIPTAAIFLSAAISVLYWERQASFYSLKAPGGTAALVALGIGSLLMGAGHLEPDCKVAQPIAEQVKSAEGSFARAQVSTLNYFEPSLLFALNPEPLVGAKAIPELSGDSLNHWLVDEGPAWLVTAVEVGKENPHSATLSESTRVERRWQKKIFNYSNGRWLVVELWLRSPVG